MAKFVDVILRLVKGTPLTYSELDTNFANLQGATVPYGSVAVHPSTEQVAGWLVCDGSSLLVASYPDLFASIGYTYGGSADNFSIPDLRAKFVRGWDSSGFADPARGFGSYQDPQFGAHTHGIVGDLNQSSGRVTYDLGEIVQLYFQQTGGYPTGSTQSTGGGVSSNFNDTFPFNVAMNYIIKAL